jgi:hypothetical protein
MKILHLLFIDGAAAFNLPLKIVAFHQNVKLYEESRADFMSKVTLTTLLSTLATVQPAAARGSATLEGSYDRYTLASLLEGNTSPLIFAGLLKRTTGLASNLLQTNPLPSKNQTVPNLTVALRNELPKLEAFPMHACWWLPTCLPQLFQTIAFRPRQRR